MVKEAAAREPKTKRSTRNRVSSASDWRAKTKGIELDLPSGSTCLVRRRSITSFLQRGTIPNGLMPLVEQAIKSGVQPSEEELREMASKDSGMIAQMLDLMDACLVECVIEPKVSAVPEDDEDRDDDKLYTDEIDYEDKAAVFAFVTAGVKNLESFLQEPSNGSEDTRDGGSVRTKTK